MRLKCATSPEQSFALPKPSPSHSLGPEWSTYLQVARKGAKTAGKCKWCFSCSTVGCRLKSVRRRRGSGLARGACGRFLEVSFIFSSNFIANVLPKEEAPAISTFRSAVQDGKKKIVAVYPEFRGGGCATTCGVFYHNFVWAASRERNFSLSALISCIYLHVDYRSHFLTRIHDS